MTLAPGSLDALWMPFTANKAFKPLVREQKYDLGELAIVTFLQAKAYGKPYVLMPATIVARGQHHTIFYNSCKYYSSSVAYTTRLH